MRLYVDLETLQLIEAPGFRNPVQSLHFKRGDAAQLEVVFLENGTTAAEIGDPATLEVQFGIKPRARYDVDYLVHESVWSLPAQGAQDPSYLCTPSFNTTELDSAMQVGSSAGAELSEISLMGEITWREGAGEPTSTRTFVVVVENDVNRGTEGVPESSNPPYPLPGSILTTDLLDQPNGVAGVQGNGLIDPAIIPQAVERFADVVLNGASVDWVVDLDNVLANGSDQDVVTFEALMWGNANVTEWRWQIMDANGLMIAQVPQWEGLYPQNTSPFMCRVTVSPGSMDGTRPAMARAEFWALVAGIPGYSSVVTGYYSGIPADSDLEDDYHYLKVFGTTLDKEVRKLRLIADGSAGASTTIEAATLWLT